MTDKPTRERTAEDGISDLERRLDDLEASTRLNTNCLLMALGSLVGSISPEDQRLISDIIRTSNSSLGGASGDQGDTIKLVADERIASLADALDRFAHVFRDLRSALAQRRKLGE